MASALKGVAVLALAGTVPDAVHSQQRMPAPPSLVFDGVTVVDVERGKLVPGQRVAVIGNRIRFVGNTSAVEAPPGAQIVDARGKFLIPGLWDMHVHPNHAVAAFYPKLLAYGVTGMRDPGSEVPLDTQRLWRREVLAGTRLGPPRQILSGKFISEEGYNFVEKPCVRAAQPKFSPQTCVASSAADARHLVDSLKAAGADMIKPYEVSREIYFALAAAARRVGLPFGGHLYPWVPLLEASDSGARIIDHRGNGNVSAELASLCVNKTATIAQCQQVAERFRRNGTWWVPTLGLGDRTPELRADSQLRIARQVGLPILAGTDSPSNGEQLGLTLHSELRRYVAEGLTPWAALRTATLNPALFLHGTDSLGTIAPGKLADLVLLDADPLADIANTTKIRAVVANGHYYDRAALDGLLAENP